MQTLKLSDQKALSLYPTAPPEWKQVLEESFGKDFFSKKITERVKTYEDACEILGIDPDIGLSCSKSGVWKDIENITAYAKLIVISRALNEDWYPDWKDSNQYKWFPWFEVSSASGFRFSVSYYGLTATCTPARLCYKSRELADYAGKQFIDLYKEFIN